MPTCVCQDNQYSQRWGAHLAFWVKGLEHYQQMMDYFLRLYSSTRQLQQAEDGAGWTQTRFLASIHPAAEEGVFSEPGFWRQGFSKTEEAAQLYQKPRFMRQIVRRLSFLRITLAFSSL